MPRSRPHSHAVGRACCDGLSGGTHSGSGPIISCFRKQRLKIVVESRVDVFLSEHGADHVLEGTHVLLVKPAVADGLALLVEKLLADPWALVRRDPHALPSAFADPLLVEKAALAERRTHTEESAVADGQHRADGSIEVIGDAGRLIDNQETYSGVRPDAPFARRQADDSAAVAQLQRQLRWRPVLQRPAQGTPQGQQLVAEQLPRCTLILGQQQYQRSRLGHCLGQRQRPRNLTLTRLTGTEEEGPCPVLPQQLRLP